MLNKIIFAKGITELQLFYKDFQLSKQQNQAWYDYLSEYKDDDFMNGIKDTIRTCNRTPYIADVIKNIEERKLSGRHKGFDFSGLSRGEDIEPK